MAQKRARRRVTREYKAQAVQRVIESGLPLADIAAELDVSPGQLSQWRNEQLAAGSAEVAPYKILSCPIRDTSNRVMGLVALFRSADADDFELRDVRILEFVSRKAVGILGSQYDPLTGLINRLIFERRAQRELDAAVGGNALLHIDVDRLQTINEAFGFRAGDEVIQRIGEVVRRCAGTEGLASRIGGDRFALLLPKRGLEEALEIGTRLLWHASQLGYLEKAMGQTQRDSSGDLSAYSFHMADMGTDALERENRIGASLMELTNTM